MAIRTIITYPHPVLRKKAAPVTVFDEALKQLIEDMAETMYDAPGVGLAANQINIALQIVVIDRGTGENDRHYLALINPRITSGEGSLLEEEGCLSVRDYMAKVKRFQKIHVTAQDVEGTPMDFVAENRFARIIQHEVDHLNGKLFVDHLSTIKRTLYEKHLKKLLQEDK